MCGELNSKTVKNFDDHDGVQFKCVNYKNVLICMNMYIFFEDKNGSCVDKWYFTRVQQNHMQN